MCEVQNSTKLIVPDGLQNYVRDAINRLSYLYPNVDFSITGQDLTFVSSGEINQQKLYEEVRYSLYRSKIRAEGEAHRSVLFSAVFSK